jgi:hypothetical protein
MCWRKRKASAAPDGNFLGDSVYDDRTSQASSRLSVENVTPAIRQTWPNMNLRFSQDAILLFFLLLPFACGMPMPGLSNSHGMQTQGSWTANVENGPAEPLTFEPTPRWLALALLCF